MPLTQTINYDVAGNFTFDSGKVTIPGGGPAALLDLSPTGSTFGATYTTDINGSFGDGTLTGTGTGSPTIVANRLDLRNFGKYVDYSATSNADFTQTGAVKFKYTPDYTTKPSPNWSIFFTICNSAGSLNNRIEFRHSSSAGQLQFRLNDSAGTSLGTFTLANWNPVAGTTYEFECNFDFTGGTHRVFIDGVLFQSFTATGTRSSAATLLRVGADYNATDTCDGQFEDFVVYNTVQHTSGYTPGYTLAETKYDITNPTIVINSGVGADGIDSLTETASKTGSDEVKYTLVFDGQDKYWTGAAWANSDGTYAQANTAADITTNASSLDIASGGIIKVKAFLHSDDGSTTPTLTQNVLTYCFFGSAPTALSRCDVWGYIQDVFGNNIQNAKVEEIPITTNATPVENFQIFGYTTVNTTSSASGYWEMSVVQSAQYSPAMLYNFKFTLPDNTTKLFKNKTVPASTTAEFNDLV